MEHNEFLFLYATPPWEWPPSAGASIREVLLDRSAKPVDRIRAAEMAGESVVFGEDIAAALLTVARSSEESEELRARAAIALGPALEEAYIDGFDEEDPLIEPPFTEAVFDEIQAALRRLVEDASQPKGVRRRALEASVRAPQDWHADAIRAASALDDPEWKLTAVFAMGHCRGFEAEILRALDSSDPVLRREAVVAAGSREIADAWPRIEPLLDEDTDKDLLLAAIEAAPWINAAEAALPLGDLMDSADEDIAEAAEEAFSMCDRSNEEEEFDEDEEDEESEEDEK